jgi:signal peptidase I
MNAAMARASQKQTVRRLLLGAALAALVALAMLLLLGALPYHLYVVHTGSMDPAIPPRSAVVVHDGEYQLGQVISYRTKAGVVTHRLVAIDGDELQTKGDANKTEDPGTIKRSQIIGGVVAAPRMLGYWLVYFKNPAGLASLFLAVICAWLVYSLPADLARQQVRRRPPVSKSPRRDLPRPVPAPVPRHAAPLSAGSHGGLAFCCSGCGARFASAGDLRAHVARYPREQTPVPERDPRWGLPVELPPDYRWRPT